ncbi:choline BCCT transporter BetT [Suttonella sp. R2A3]|uniref:choline BCCT transporter BetT n=1 Tax=Suttonella sp. R2A3 TaxID=2908648 RepID=UPI001F27F8EB|nr:choline BCCT transporter BetT [Suttonella sp. R2A3]UJF24049.1 choline BCCT transporter BetT [Suttonella sp. R2A3]
MSTQNADAQLSTNTQLNKIVFYVATAVTIFSVIFTMAFQEQSGAVLATMQSWISDKLGWYYMLVVAAYLIFMIYIGLSRFGDIKLGPDHAKPDFPFITWASMLFAAGIGIDLLFFGASEPLSHFLTAPGARAEEINAARIAITQTFLHWGMHGWGIYVLIGMALAYFAYRKRQPLALRSALLPLIGAKRTAGWMGDAVDIFGIVCTVFGIATSLGIGVLQANAGLDHIFGIAPSKLIQTIIIVLVITIAAISATTGVERGVRRLSEINMGMAALLLVALLAMGPTLFLLDAFVQNVGDYFQTVIGKTFDVYAYQGEEGQAWKSGWTVFFWAWWVAWAPFVGMFIARISRGRTLREFVFGVLFIPLGFIFAWFSIFGNSAIDLYLGGFSELGNIAINDPAMGLFALLDQYPLAKFWASVAVIIGLIFFVTSADSGALVLANLSMKGLTPEEDAPIRLRLFWAALMGLITLGLLFAGGFGALQAVNVIAALPFSVVLLLYLWSLNRSLREEMNKKDAEQLDFAAAPTAGGLNWRERVSRIISYPSQRKVTQFIDQRVREAMGSVSAALKENGVTSKIEASQEQDSIAFRAFHHTEMDFIYRVVPASAPTPVFMYGQGGSKAKSKGDDRYWRAEVYLREGGRGYDIMGYTTEQIINDILNQYERHMHFIHGDN